MKALTIWQPWASLIAWGEKRYETRSWAPAHRGPLAIHASIQDATVHLIPQNFQYMKAFERAGVSWEEALPGGVVLCTVDLVDVVRVETLRGKISQAEEQFGDYSAGRFAWRLENVRLLERPISARGLQGLWEWPVDLNVLELPL